MIFKKKFSPSSRLFKLVLRQNDVSFLTVGVLTGNSSDIDDKLGANSVDCLVYLTAHSGDDLY